MVNDNFRYSVTFSNLTKSFWFETTQYVDNSTYLNVILRIIKSIETSFPDIISKRIGMRFINEFHSPSLKTISKVFNSNISKNITVMASQQFISRVISQEEYNYSSSKMRVQYGIPNKFYPAILNNFDLVLDIDSFDDTQQKIETWEAILTELNHSAYTKFTEVINPKYLEELK